MKKKKKCFLGTIIFCALFYSCFFPGWALEYVPAKELIKRSLEDMKWRSQFTPRPEDFGVYQDRRGKYKWFITSEPNSIPQIIKKKADNYLKFRIGVNYFRLCKFSEYRITKRSKRQIFPYDWYDDVLSITYELSIPFSPIQNFPISIILNSKGKLLEPLRVPDLFHFPQKAKIIDLKQAMKITKDKFIIKNDKDLFSSMNYNTQFDSFTWLIHSEVQQYDERGLLISPVLEIIANNPTKWFIQNWVVKQ